MADDRHGAYEEHLAKIGIVGLGDSAEPLLAAGLVLARDQPQPGRQTPPGLEHMRSGMVATSALATSGPTPGISLPTAGLARPAVGADRPAGIEQVRKNEPVLFDSTARQRRAEIGKREFSQ
ncbi:MAG: hypothetical protein H7Y19_08050 [Luteimonas sp.]|nr:hypothetical protein [Luteimonas sp.]